MSKKATLTLSVVILAAFAQAAQTQGSEQPPSLLESILSSVVPFLIIAGVVWWVFMGAVRKMHKRGLEHNQRVEALLERIVNAVERKDKDVV